MYEVITSTSSLETHGSVPYQPSIKEIIRENTSYKSSLKNNVNECVLF